MNTKNTQKRVFSKTLRTNNRTYFFDVSHDKHDNHLLTITESVKHANQDGSYSFRKHKLFLFEKDFIKFKEMLSLVYEFVENNKNVDSYDKAIKLNLSSLDELNQSNNLTT